MYSRQPDRNFRVPHNYSGNIFNGTAQPPTPVEDHTRRSPRTDTATYRDSQTKIYDAEANLNDTSSDDISESCKPTSANAKIPILSPFGALGTEEILLIALALIIFQSGKEPELALILLALLFIN